MAVDPMPQSLLFSNLVTGFAVVVVLLACCWLLVVHVFRHGRPHCV